MLKGRTIRCFSNLLRSYANLFKTLLKKKKKKKKIIKIE